MAPRSTPSSSRPTTRCLTTLLAGENKVFYFSATDVGSPEPNFGFTLNTTRKRKRSKSSFQIEGMRKKNEAAIKGPALKKAPPHSPECLNKFLHR